MPKTSKCYKCNSTLTRGNYNREKDALVCYVCVYPDPDNPGVINPTLNMLEPQDYIDMGIKRDNANT